jgi:hypothetical protein
VESKDVTYSRFQVYNSSLYVEPTNLDSSTPLGILKPKVTQILSGSTYKDMDEIKTDQFLAFANYIYKGLSTVLKPFQKYGMLAHLPISDLPKHKATDQVL